jgi:hypothetical protein
VTRGTCGNLVLASDRLRTENLHVFVAFASQIPAIENVLFVELLHDVVVVQELTAEDIRKDTSIMVKVDGEEFFLQRDVDFNMT